MWTSTAYILFTDYVLLFFILLGRDNKASKSLEKRMKVLKISTAHNHLSRRKTLLALIIITSIISLLGTTSTFNTNVNDKTVSAADSVFYDFISKAPTASWGSGAGSLPFPGSDSDSRGFALYRDKAQLEDGSTRARVLETHPQWVSNGWIIGVYPQLTIPSDAELKITVGFLQGATGSDGVTFEIQFEEFQGLKVAPKKYSVLSCGATYDGKLDLISKDLNYLAGKTGNFILYVNAGQSSGQDWAAWAEAKIEVAAPAALPDLKITDVWNSDGQLCYSIKNIGEGSVGGAGAPISFYNVLFIDGERVAEDLVTTPLASGQELERCFDYQWQMTPTQHTIRVCADWEQNIKEENEQNNCLEQKIEPPEKDIIPPAVAIFHSPADVSLVSNVTFTVVATDDTNVTKIVIYVNETAVFECEPPEYFWKDNYWQCIYVGGPYPVGTLTYKAEAFDPEGNKGVSVEKRINVTGMEWKPPPAELVLPCYISGRLYNFTYYSKTLRVKISEAAIIGGSCSPTPPFSCLEPIIIYKPGGAVWYVNVTRLWAGEEHYRMPGPMEYQAQVSCNGTYLIQPVFQPYGDECEWQGTWIPSKANSIVMNGTSVTGYDFTFSPIDDTTAPGIDVRTGPVRAPAEFRGQGNWNLSVYASDSNGIQKIKITGNRTVSFFASNESGPLPRGMPAGMITPVFKECNTSPCEISIPYFENGEYISFDLRISACDSVGNKVETSYSRKFPDETGDVSIVSVEPVQVVYGAPLVKYKGTAFRVKVNSNFPYPIETRFRLTLPETQWNVIQFTGWSYPEIWGPIKIPANATNYEVMLPIIPDWQRDMNVSATNPAGLMRYECEGGVCRPDIRVLPKPIADSVSFSVEIDPTNQISETNEGSNVMISPDYEVITTRSYSFAVFRVIGGEENSTCAPSFDSVYQAFKNNFDYLVGTYPIADGKISFSIMPNPDITYDTTEEDRGDFLRRIYRMVRSDYDWAVGVTCGCCGGTCMYDYTGWDTHAVLIGNNTDNIHNLAHEVNHVLMGAPDCYGCGDPDSPADCDQCRADEGFWVNGWQRYPTNATEAWLHGCYIMDFSNYAPHCWMRLNPVGRDEGGSFNDGYLNMIDELTSSHDPEGLLVSGEIYRNNTIILDPFSRLSNVTLDIEPGEEGEYYIVLLDSSGETLNKSGFYAAFYETPSQPASEMVELDKAVFACVVEWEEGTKRIELQDKNGNVLASREVSPNTPEVEVLYPNGGEVWEKGKTYNITWEASDKDGDVLTCSLAISENNGETWLPLDIDVTGNEYQLNTLTLEEGQNYLVRVRATDGVNTGEDVSDGVFTITTVEKAEINWWLILGIVVGVAIIASLLVIRLRKKA
jgi:hypothetical protein